MRRITKVGVLGIMMTVLVMAAVVVHVDVASASTQYVLNVDYCTNSCLNGGTGGTVTLTDLGGGAVKVEVALNPVLFHNTNAFASFAFNLVGNPAITVDTISSNGGTTFALISGSAGSIHNDGSGFFEYALDQTAGPSAATTLSFVVHATGLTEASFAEKSSGGDISSYFSAAVTGGADCTGVIGSDGTGTPKRTTTGGSTCGNTVAEPATLLLVGSALIGFGIVARGKKWMVTGA